ncbi:MAG: thioredoxin domain-containing protein [Acidobacteria bacterium]|nr:thioredoxin domain-containing protein [Acidobacteriota bacterium]MBV9475653.1 thioredoxin domain-containing protein [Acidobacteriota bacterium]
MTNRLARETSPYLLQHAHNPVDWYPWGEEAWAKSRAEDKPVFLSIGYSACHWCHVMERESFEDDATARVLNEHFVSIKVDREERPDLDSIYMQAVQMMTGHGGWPMSTFLTPQGKPFFAGTYFPPEDRHGMPAFRRVLEHVVNVYRTRRAEVDEASDEVARALGGSLRLSKDGQTITHDALDRAASRIAAGYDPVHGGFGSAPKFPPSMSLDFLMQVAYRGGDARLREIVVNTLTKMARGGMYDQIGGGFHRYSTDARWLVPHFEKMLYDNALLARLYTRAWQWTHDPLFARIANEILGYVAREMTSPDGGFYSTLDADSEGEEGKFYVWTRAEVLELLGGDEGRVFCALYDVTEGGNWEGHNILNVPRDPASVAADLGIELVQLDDIVARGKCKLYGAREQRVRPGRDEKILSGWNGWMLAAFAEAALAFDKNSYREIVLKNASYLLTRIVDGKLSRHAHIAGLLEDYSGVAWGLTLAYEATHERRFFDGARSLVEQMLARFRDEENGGFYDTPSDHEQLITRPKDLFDNATPAGTSVACEVLLRHALLFGEERYAQIATETLERMWPVVEKYASGFGFALGVAEWRATQPREIAITGDDDTSRVLTRVVGETFLPHRVLVAGRESADLPLMEQRPQERAMAYVCVGYACEEPTSDPERLRELLG